MEFYGEVVEKMGGADAVESSSLLATCERHNRVARGYPPRRRALRASGTVFRIDTTHFRPTVVEMLLGDTDKARARLG